MNKHSPAALLATALAALLCGGTAAQAPDPRDLAPAPVTTHPAAPTLPRAAPELTDFERRFLDRVAQDGAAQVDASRLVLERSQNVEVKQFAQMLISDHGDADQQLQQLASVKDLKLAPGMAAEDENALARLRPLHGTALDREYRERFGVQAHRQAIARYERAAHEARDEDVQKFIASTLPTLRRHLHMAEDLVGDTGPLAPPALSQPTLPAAPMMQR